LFVGVIEEVEQLSQNLFYKERHVLKTKHDLNVCKFVDDVDDIERNSGLLRSDDP
jgi:hypothetical protein